MKRKCIVQGEGERHCRGKAETGWKRKSEKRRKLSIREEEDGKKRKCKGLRGKDKLYGS